MKARMLNSNELRNIYVQGRAATPGLPEDMPLDAINLAASCAVFAIIEFCKANPEIEPPPELEEVQKHMRENQAKMKALNEAITSVPIGSGLHRHKCHTCGNAWNATQPAAPSHPSAGVLGTLLDIIAKDREQKTH